MIDATRWVLTETWLSLGLRIRWGSKHTHGRKDWQTGERDTRFFYAGWGEWIVLDQSRRPPGWPAPSAPVLSTADMKHELAHYIAATEEQRELTNFGIGQGQGDDETEMRAMIVERGLDAAIGAAARILALGAR